MLPSKAFKVSLIAASISLGIGQISLAAVPSCENIKEYLDCSGTGRKIDISFVFDTTGSMGEEIAAMKQAVVDFVNTIKASGVDYRLGLTDYEDHPTDACGGVEDSPHKVLNGGNLTSDVTVMRSLVDSLVANAGGDEPEAVLDALMATAQQVKWRGGDAQKVIVLIGDAPPHEDSDSICNPNGYTLSGVINKLREQGIIVHVVSSSDFSKMKQIADQTGGNFYEMKNDGTNFNNIINTIASVLTCSYKIHSEFFCKDGNMDVMTKIIGKNNQTLPHIEGSMKFLFEGCGSNGKCTNKLDLLPSTTSSLTSYKNSTSIKELKDVINLSTTINICGKFSKVETAKIACEPCKKGVTPIPEAPAIETSVDGNNAQATWTTPVYAQKYYFYYAPYSNPISDVTLKNIQQMDMGLQATIGGTLSSGMHLYVAAQAINCSGESYFSNIGEIKIP